MPRPPDPIPTPPAPGTDEPGNPAPGATSPGSGAPATRGIGRRIRRGRRLSRRVGIALFILVVIPVVLTRSALVRWIIEPRLEGMLGGKVTMTSAAITPGGEVVLRGVRVAAEGAPQPAATVLEARRIDIRLSLRSLLSRSPRVKSIALIAPVVRISQSKADGKMTLQALAPRGGPGGGPLPSVSIVEGVIELGEHDASTYSRLIRLPVSGDLTPSPKEPSVYLVRFQGLPDEQRAAAFNERARMARPAPTILEGQIDVATMASRLRLSNVDLASWGTQWAPSAVRDRWTALAIEGRLSQAEFSYAHETGPAAEVTLEDVGLTLPVSATEAEADDDATTLGPPGRNLRMTDVRGTVRFDTAALKAAVTGVIEDLKYRVILTTEGLALNAPFSMDVETAEPFTVGAHPSLLPFAPPIVRERFRTFSGPTAVVEGLVTIKRGPPTDAGVAPEPTIDGRLRFRDGVARYEGFPYPISNLGGLVRFTEKAIHIESITGSNASGARLHAEGTIAPPTDGSAVDLRIAVVDLPLDEELEEAMPESRKGLMAALFDTEQFKRRVADGLLQTSAAKAEADRALADAKTRAAVLASRGEPAGALEAEIRDLERRVAIPVFDPGARATLDVRVMRALGHGDGMWSSDVHVSLPRAGIFCREFPYPCEVRGGTIAFTDERGHVEFADAVGLTGGTWSITGDVELMNEKGEKTLVPHFLVKATGAPVDTLLLEALPTGGGADGAPGADARTGPAPISAHDVLAAMNLSGSVDCEVRVEPLGEAINGRPRLGFEAKVALHDIAAAPGGVPILSGLHGEAFATQREVRAEGLVGRLAQGDLLASVHAEFGSTEDGEARRPSIAATATVTGLDLASPIDALAGVFDDSAAARLRDLHARHSPRGAADVRLVVPGPAADATSAAPTFEVWIERLRDASFAFEGGRIGAATTSGRVAMTPSAIRFEQLAAPLTLDGDPIADVALDGALAMGDSPQELRAQVRGLRLEGPITRRLLALGNEGAGADRSPDAMAGFSLESLRGVVDADLRCRTGGAQDQRVWGEVFPRSFSIDRAGTTLAFPEAAGTIAFDGLHGTVEGLALTGEGLRLEADGRWGASPGLTLDLAVRGASDSLDERVRALLPAEALDAARAMELTVNGPIRLEDGVVRVQPGVAGDRDATVSGVVRFTDASARFGIAARQASGAMSFHAENRGPAPGGAPAPEGRFDVSLSLDSAIVGGVQVTDALARVRTGDQPGEILVPAAEASSHGGRISGSARVGDDEQGRRQFSLEFVAGGVALGEVVADLRRASGAQIPDGPAPNRGELDASLSLRGLVEDPASHEGRGDFAVSGGEIINMPGVMRLIELSNLTAPMGEQLQETFAAFHVRGELATFDTLQIASKSITLLGEGAVRMPDLGMDLRFTSRGSFRLPLLSDIFEGLRDEIVTVTVTGTPDAPEFGSTTLAGTRAMMGDIFRPDPRRRAAPTPVAPATSPRDRNE